MSAVIGLGGLLVFIGVQLALMFFIQSRDEAWKARQRKAQR